MNTAEDEFAELVLPQVRDLWARLDPVPAGLTDDIKYALTVRLLEAEVAELMQVPEMATRATGADLTRSISFTGARLSLMVMVTEQDEGMLRLDCWVTVGGAVVELHVGDAVREETADEFGRLVFTDVPSGTIHFITWADASRQDRPVITPNVEL